MRPQLDQLSDRLGYRFRNPELLDAALTHRSVGRRNNERLEFLGDALLNFVIGRALYDRCPQASEGVLSRLRASLVKGDTLAAIARDLDLGRSLRLGAGARKTGGHRSKSILADALEAVLGAVCLDGGTDAGTAVVQHLFADRLANLPAEGELKDPKTRLQEYLQAQAASLPIYQLEAVTGPEHGQRFEVLCQIPAAGVSFRGVGSSRREAEQQAASLALLSVTGG
ncbi:MAG TPA: ribonuclease III [Candidatus Macondimonas sp.]|nr:ribonuclease III [Candidatus Macondimonas sp.]